MSGFPREPAPAEADAARQQARGLVDEVRKIAERLAANKAEDVVWLSERDPARGGNQLCVAPLQVWGALRDKLLTDKTVICTSATLKLGGDFTSLALRSGCKPASALTSRPILHAPDHAGSDGRGGSSEDGDEAANDEARGRPVVLPWRGIDVGSPFDYARQGILYVARSLPPPGRDGIGPAQLEEIQQLVEAAGGPHPRAVLLAPGRRGGRRGGAAAVPHLPILCQGDGQLAHLQAEFVANPAVSLFGTLSLWQGLDVPGETCELVIIDRIPFPRPDDPLMSARALAADRAGGNGFMAVSATHAALLLAQGTGRLIRTQRDRGVVAVLDPRLATARYGTFLRASLPPMWVTNDGAVVRAALSRLQAPVP